MTRCSDRRSSGSSRSSAKPLNRLRRLDPSTAAQVSDLPRIVAFRNVLVHGYALIDNELVWEVATTRVVLLADELRELLGDDDIA